MIHLQGMGVIGCALAIACREHGIPFTWSDTFNPVTAWRASTGCIYPTSNEYDLEAYRQWGGWTNGDWANSLIRGCLEQAGFWYSTKAAPHGGKYASIREVGPLKLHPLPSYHFNPRAFVEQTRLAFRERMAERNPHDYLVVSHGFNLRLKRYIWGWSQVVTLDTSAVTDSRAAFYLREGRFVMAYAYPMANTPFHFIGSTMLVQNEARIRDASKDVQRWHARFERLSGGLVKVVQAEADLVQGWRPCDEQGDAGRIWETHDGALVVKPMAHSGIRHLPHVVNQFLDIHRGFEPR